MGSTTLPHQIKEDLDVAVSAEEDLGEVSDAGLVALHRGLNNTMVWLKRFFNSPLRFLLLLFIIVIIL